VTTSESDLRLHHLDTVQSIINRLSQNSFTIRGWSVTVVSIVFAIAGSRSGKQNELALLAIIPIWVFWGLDAYYLRQERLFRQLHAAVARRLVSDHATPDVAPFEMNLEPYRELVKSPIETFLSMGVAAIPCALTLIAVGVAVFV
jgi:hypothetical protein